MLLLKHATTGNLLLVQQRSFISHEARAAAFSLDKATKAPRSAQTSLSHHFELIILWLRAGVIVEFPELTVYMKVHEPCSLITLPTDLLRTWPQQGLTLDELQMNSPRPEFVKKGIVLANFVTPNGTDFAAIAISDPFCWLTKPDYTEVRGYVEIAFLREEVPNIAEPGSWPLRECWLV